MIKGVSVIVPIYNCESTVIRCLKSIMSNIYVTEIICINDGSNDNSLKLLEQLRASDKRIKIISQTNKGLSHARNIGIKNASSTYLMFVDADDFITKDCTSLLVDEINRNNNDLIIFNHTKNERNIVDSNVIQVESIDKPKILQCVISFEILTSVCFIIVKKELFIKNNIMFPEGKTYEDASTLYKLVFYSNKPAKISNQFYHYLPCKGSITKTTNICIIDDIFESIFEIYGFLKFHNLSNLYYLVSGRVCALTNGRILNLGPYSSNKKNLDYLVHKIGDLDQKYPIPEETVISWFCFLVNHNAIEPSKLLQSKPFDSIVSPYIELLARYNYDLNKVLLSGFKYFNNNSFLMWGETSISETISTQAHLLGYKFKGYILGNFSPSIINNHTVIKEDQLILKESLTIIVCSISSAYIINEKFTRRSDYSPSQHQLLTFYQFLKLMVN